MAELPPPPGAGADPGAVELLRAWVIGAELHCALQGDAFEDVDSWGEVLADVAGHLARARHQADGTPPAETLRRIRAVFAEELDALAAAEGAP